MSLSTPPNVIFIMREKDTKVQINVVPKPFFMINATTVTNVINAVPVLKNTIIPHMNVLIKIAKKRNVITNQNMKTNTKTINTRWQTLCKVIPMPS